ncbi:MAG: hypothetical protein QOH06_4286 [Acidobacteriota bacterium]|jgi:natural product precursor|nr:hypothetical protein [Acidobacteriota bacterium]
MKKRISKLRLNRETLRSLTGRDLMDVAGGATGWNTCGCPTYISDCSPCVTELCSGGSCPSWPC